MPARVQLQHTPPAFVSGDSWFFITLCCRSRGTDQLCRSSVASALLDDAVRYHQSGRWVLQLFLLMPDHLHAVLATPQPDQLAETIRNWKRLTARMHGIGWQKNFFDHRLRSNESLETKARYIRENPVRAGLVTRAEDWPYFLDHNSVQGR